MDFPDKVKVGAHEYKVLFPYKFKERDDYAGQADHLLLELRVTETDPCGNKKAESKIIGTLLHEIIHAVSVTWDIGLEEGQVIKLEEGLLSVMVDNGFLKIGG